jgi:putative Ca2+/H+ antiporter (TMEM165/GDT1 family)
MEMKRRLVFAAAGISLLAVTASAVAMGHWLSVRPGEFDPLKTRLVQATWVKCAERR